MAHLPAIKPISVSETPFFLDSRQSLGLSESSSGASRPDGRVNPTAIRLNQSPD